MQNTIIALCVLAGVACERHATKLETADVAPQASLRAALTAARVAPTKKLFLDVHELGPGKVTAAAVADAHKKDLAVQGKYGVNFRAYWVNEKEGKIYCLAEAPSPEATTLAHKEAHGLVAQHILEVSEGR